MTAAWARGFAAGSGYSVNFQAAQTPGHLALVCAMAGVDWAPRARMAVADLGCGRGYTANLLAAANPEWTVLGLDAEPASIAEATQFAATAGLPNALFSEADLGAMADAEIDRLPPLDVVMLHGVWSWVSDAVRGGIVRLLARRLKPGGLVYVGYNALPAAGVDAGLQRLLRHLAGAFGSGAGEAAAAAQRAMGRLRDLAPGLPLPRSPMLARLLADPAVLEAGFVAQEFLTAHWRPSFQADLARELQAAKLSFVGSAHLFEALPGLFCEPSQLEVMAGLGTGVPREFIKDLCLPRAFRADVFIRGARAVDPLVALERLVLTASRALPEESPGLGTGASHAVLDQAVWVGIRAALSEAPMALGTLRARLGDKPPHPAELLAVLSGTDCVLPVWRAQWSGPGGGPWGGPGDGVGGGPWGRPGGGPGGGPGGRPWGKREGVPGGGLGVAPGGGPPSRRFNLAAAQAHGNATQGHFALASPVLAGGLPASGPELRQVAALLRGNTPHDTVEPGRMAVWRGLGIVD